MPISLDAQWQLPDSQPIPTTLLSWLNDSGSLTEKLKALPGEFHVEVLGQSKGIADTHEYKAMDIIEQPVLIREVLLHCDGQPLVYARSILPLQALSNATELSQLGSNPLGELLFNRTDIRLGPIEIASFPSSSAVGKLNLVLHSAQEQLWGRRRCFHLPETPILVAEVFLSNAPCYA